MRKVRVIKKSKNENSFRTPLSDLDYINSKPEEGRGFHIISSTHESGGIFTSDVEKVEDMGDMGFIVYTRFSVYKIEYLEDSE